MNLDAQQLKDPFTWHDRQVSKKLFEQRRIDAAAKRTPGQQIVRLDAKFGVGVGAAKERAKLQARMDVAHKAALEKRQGATAALVRDVSKLLEKVPGLDSKEGREMRRRERDKRRGKKNRRRTEMSAA